MVMYLGNIVELGGTEEVIHKPLHPYTKALISAVPVPDPKLQRERSLPPLKSMEISRLTESMRGCKFYPRCPYGTKECAEKMPELVETKGRFVACFLYD